MSAGTPWTEADDARLAVLWAEGATSGGIAAEMGRTRNAVIGRVHRLHLPYRPSPIPGFVQKARKSPERPEKAQAVIVAPPPLPAPRPAPVRACQYPHGDPGEPGFHYCGEPVWRGVYCRVCFARCYQRLPVAA